MKPDRTPMQADLLTTTQFDWLRQAIAQYGGILLDKGHRKALENAIAQQSSILNMPLNSYLHVLRQADGRTELQTLVEALLNHETSFFRNRPHLRILQEVVLNELHAIKPIGTPIRIWSAGCATGEEPYSLAIIAREWMRTVLGRQIEIIATDLSADALQKARTGLYRGRTLQYLPNELQTTYFESHGGSYVVNDSLRSLIQFYQVNLLEPFPAWTQRIDLIFCQNVIIYFAPPVRRKLIEQFHACLPAHGLLFLGFSETLWNVFDGFRSRDIGGSFVYQKRSEPPTPPHPPVRKRAALPSAPALPAKPAQLERMPVRPLHVLPTPNPAVLDRAREYADRGEFEQAISAASAVLTNDTLNDEAYVLLGMIYTQQGRWELAIQQLDRARYLRPEAPLISFHLASAYAQLGMFEHAQREYRSTLWKLRSHAPDTLIDGVAVAWIGETCQRQLDSLAGTTAKGRGR